MKLVLVQRSCSKAGRVGSGSSFEFNDSSAQAEPINYFCSSNSPSKVCEIGVITHLSNSFMRKDVEFQIYG